MNTTHQVALIAASSVLLAACASSGGMASAPAQSYHAPDQVVQDAEYVAIVERMARRRGVNVHWFNPPVKRVAATEGPGDGLEPEAQ